MCGISCIVALYGQTHQAEPYLNGHTPKDATSVDISHDDYARRLSKELDLSLDMIEHRGPDSRGQWISDDKRVGPRPSQL